MRNTDLWKRKKNTVLETKYISHKKDKRQLTKYNNSFKFVKALEKN